VVPIDVDLQDSPKLVVAMIEQWRRGYDVVLARRTTRNKDSRAKRVSAAWFYRVHNWIAEPAIPENVGDFRLMDRTVVDALNALPESGRFMKGLFAWVGFQTTCIDYVRPGRAAGSSKFVGRRLWNFALEGLMSFGPFPLRIWTYLGGLVALASFLYALFHHLEGLDRGGRYAGIRLAVRCRYLPRWSPAHGHRRDRRVSREDLPRIQAPSGVSHPTHLRAGGLTNGSEERPASRFWWNGHDEFPEHRRRLPSKDSRHRCRENADSQRPIRIPGSVYF